MKIVKIKKEWILFYIELKSKKYLEPEKRPNPMMK